jgi:MFS transporter, Spinster family, sphingosine-1-phosphate transporter
MSKDKYRNYLLTVLVLVLASNMVDRLTIGLLLQDIKRDLTLSDTQLGLLTGIAFALFYSLMGIPIARWADRGNRVTIISVTAALWSLAVAMCGLAGNFTHLLLIRIGVAVGEAGCIAPAHSLIADYFSREERPRAVARYMLGGPVSVFVGYFLAGWLNEFYGWRITFMVIGAPGLVLALMVRMTLKEPRIEAQAISISAQPKYKEALLTLTTNTTFYHLLLSFAVMSFFGYGMAKWQPSFFVRSYGLNTGELGTWFAVIWGLGAIVGTYVGGEWACRFATHNEARQLRIMVAITVVATALSALTYVAPNEHVAFALMGFAAVGSTATAGPLFAMIQSLVSPRLRATAIAVLYLFANLIGMGLGPLAAGALSDAFRPTFGEDSLRYALLALCPGYLWGSWHLLRASKTVMRDINALNSFRAEALDFDSSSSNVAVDASRI